jgi:hypothetical protein
MEVTKPKKNCIISILANVVLDCNFCFCFAYYFVMSEFDLMGLFFFLFIFCFQCVSCWRLELDIGAREMGQ